MPENQTEPQADALSQEHSDEWSETLRILNLVVRDEYSGWRLDHYLQAQIRRLSRTKIKMVIATQVTLNGKTAPRPACKVHFGDKVKITRPAPDEPDVPRYFDVVAQSDSFLVLDKPAGLPMHATAKFWRNTLVAVMRERFPDDSLQICHRIDRETSGLILAARGRTAAAFLKGAFAKRRVEKSYLAIVHGVPEKREGEIDLPLALLDSPTKIRMGVVTGGLPSITKYVVLKSGSGHALLQLEPLTGRQHQIRVHLAAIGHPIVGDKMYMAGEEAFMDYCDNGMSPVLLKKLSGLSRQALHAHSLTFPDPITKEAVTVTCPLPLDLLDFVARYID